MKQRKLSLNSSSIPPKAYHKTIHYIRLYSDKDNPEYFIDHIIPTKAINKDQIVKLLASYTGLDYYKDTATTPAYQFYDRLKIFNSKIDRMKPENFTHSDARNFSKPRLIT